MNRLRFYFNHSLIGHFYHRAKDRWFTPRPSSQLDYFGVKLQMDVIPEGMQRVIRSGAYEFSEVKILPSLISSSDQILEIGAAIGFVGLYCRKISKVTSLVSVEPNPTTLSYLRQNYELNGITPCVIEAALTATDGPTPFHASDMFWGDGLTQHPQAVSSKLITVQGLTFASLVKQAGIEFNMLIIDVEGAEQHLPIDSLPEHVKKILIELHPEIIGIRQAYNVLEKLICAGFNVQDHCHNSWALMRT